MDEQFAIATHSEPGTARQRPSQPVGWKSGQSVGDAKHLAQFRRRIHLRYFYRGKRRAGLLEQWPVGRLATKRDPVEPSLGEQRPVA